MPTGDTTLTLLDDSWDSPMEDFSALEDSAEASPPQPGAGAEGEEASNLSLHEQWVPVYGIPTSAWADLVFASINADIARRAAARNWQGNYPLLPSSKLGTQASNEGPPGRQIARHMSDGDPAS